MAPIQGAEQSPLGLRGTHPKPPGCPLAGGGLGRRDREKGGVGREGGAIEGGEGAELAKDIL